VNKKVLIVGLVLVLPLIVLLAKAFGHDPHEIHSPLIGRQAPPFALQPLGGGDPVTLAAYQGKPTVVNFWATWCEPCKAEHGVLRDAARLMGDRVNFVGVVYEDTPEAIQAFLAAHGSGYTTLVDEAGKTAIAYGVYGVPETFFLDTQGKIVAKYEGPLSPASIASYLQPLMATR
jgi:cytochrome c biogenesis protein CcmG/thiol:disulfide interchange protein DsbE